MNLDKAVRAFTSHFSITICSLFNSLLTPMNSASGSGLQAQLLRLSDSDMAGSMLPLELPGSPILWAFGKLLTDFGVESTNLLVRMMVLSLSSA